jgi:predicted alpha/beta-fold hydrolase
MSHPFPTFEPHPLLSNGHVQTIVGRYLPCWGTSLPSTESQIALADGDQLLVAESIPKNWSKGDPMALLVHGLGSCANAPYVLRLGVRLFDLGVRVVRVNLRSAGRGFGLARGTYHAGRTEDLRTVAKWMTERAVGSPLALVGYSLGGNMVLKLAAEVSETPLPGLDCVLATGVPIDLRASSDFIRGPRGRFYDRRLVRYLITEIVRLHRHFPDLGPVHHVRKARSIFEFDDAYTAPRNGFSSALDYYTKSSSGPRLGQIRVDGLMIQAKDDPFVPFSSYREVRLPPGLKLEVLERGGHLGFLNRRRLEGNRRWLDARLSAWLSQRWGLKSEGTRRDSANALCHNDASATQSRPGGQNLHV